MLLRKIYKKTNTDKIQEWQIEVDGNKYRIITGQKGGKKIISEWTICYGKNIGKINETTPEQQTLSEAIALRTKKLNADYVEEIDEIFN